MNQKLFWLAAEGMKGEKRSSMLRILILFLSFTFVVVTLSITGSLNKTGEEYRYNQYGTWKVAALEAEEKDAVLFAESNAVDEVGSAQIYGTVVDSLGTPVTAIGVLDSNLIKIGRISLQAGRMPSEENEIAVEADVLSALGYDYTLNQSIVLRIQREETVVEEEYLLCGIIKEYTNIWSHDQQMLVGAMGSAKGMSETGGPLSYQYFITSDKTNAQLIVEFGKKCRLTQNAAAYSGNTQQSYHFFYIIIILLTTILAVLSIYMVQIQKQIRSIALLRSIGGTKRQLRQKLFYETMWEVIPAVVLGSFTGIALTWVMVGLMITVDRKNFYVDIPIGLVGIAGIVWLLSVFFSKGLVLQYAFRQPLTGRIVTNHRIAAKTRRARQTGLVLLAAVFCLTGIFAYLQSLSFLYIRDEWRQLCDYSLYASGENYITMQEIQDLEKIPGIQELVAERRLIGELAFENMEESRLIAEIVEEGYKTQPSLTAEKQFPEGVGVYIYGIREENIEDFLEETGSQIDREAFVRGEQVIVWFGNGEEMSCDNVDDTGLAIGEEITLRVYAMGKKEEGLVMLESPKIAGEKSVCVGEVLLKDGEEVIDLTVLGNHFYTVIASENFIWNLLKEAKGTGLILSNGSVMSKEQGYSQLRILAGDDASYLDTDYIVSVIAQAYGNQLDNSREENAAHRQEAERNLIFLWVACFCISMIMLLLIWNILVVSGQEMRKKYGILRAIGMSKRQMRASVLESGIALSAGGLVTAFGFYFLYMVCLGVWRFFAFQEEKEYGNAIDSILHELKAETDSYLLHGFDVRIFCLICAGMLVLLFFFYSWTQRKAVKGNPMELLREERG